MYAFTLTEGPQITFNVSTLILKLIKTSSKLRIVAHDGLIIRHSWKEGRKEERSIVLWLCPKANFASWTVSPN